MRKMSYAVVIIILCYSCFVSGCFFLNREEQNEYHEQVEELERHITDELGDYIVIDNYDPDVYTLPSAGFRGKIAAWNFSFKKKYIEDDTKTKQHTPISIIERVRSLYNEYVNEHAEYALNNYVVEILINVPRSHKPPYEWYAAISNWDWENCQPSGKELSTVRLFYPKPDDSYSFSFGEWDYYYDHQDIEIAQMDDDSTMDQIIEVADNMPYLKYIAVKDQDTADEASRLRPDMKFVGIS